MVCAGSPRSHVSAYAAANMAWRSGEKIGELARFSAKASVRVASRRDSSSMARCNFLTSRQSRTSLVTVASASTALPSGGRPDIWRFASTERRRGVVSRSPNDVGARTSGWTW